MTKETGSNKSEPEELSVSEIRNVLPVISQLWLMGVVVLFGQQPPVLMKSYLNSSQTEIFRDKARFSAHYI